MYSLARKASCCAGVRSPYGLIQFRYSWSVDALYAKGGGPAPNRWPGSFVEGAVDDHNVCNSAGDGKRCLLNRCTDTAAAVWNTTEKRQFRDPEGTCDRNLGIVLHGEQRKSVHLFCLDVRVRRVRRSQIRTPTAIRCGRSSWRTRWRRFRRWLLASKILVSCDYPFHRFESHVGRHVCSAGVFPENRHGERPAVCGGDLAGECHGVSGEVRNTKP